MTSQLDKRFKRSAAYMLVSGALLSIGGCGAGGAGGLIAGIGPTPDAGIGGTGLISTGTVTGTGSIFVNGIRFDVENASILIDGEAASEDQLGLGMVVTVDGTVAEDGVNGVAETVELLAELAGPITTIERNADNSSVRLTVLGQVVIAEETSTVFEGIRFESLVEGDGIAVWGYVDEDGRLRATRVEAEDISDEVALTGVVADFMEGLFRIGEQVVDASTAALLELPGDSLSDGLEVEVEGQLVDGIIVATEVSAFGDLPTSLEVDEQLIVEGAIGSFVSQGQFTVDGVPVDASAANLSTGGFELANDLVVEVDGLWDGSQLIASSITSRRGRIEIQAPLSDISVDSSQVSVEIAGSTLTIQLDSRTLVDDDRDDIEYLLLNDLGIGDYVEIEARLEGDTLIATRVDRDSDDDEVTLQAPVESFVDGSSVTLLGITFELSEAQFENVGDFEISASAFFENLSNGDLVRVLDDEPSDGFVEAVEYEFIEALDGAFEFLEDDEILLDESELPEAALALLETFYPDNSIAFIELEDDEIAVFLADGTVVEFGLDGSFIEVDEIDEDDEEEESAEDEEPEDEDSPEDEESEDDESAEDEESEEEESPEDEEEPAEDEESEEEESPEDEEEPAEDEEPEEEESPEDGEESTEGEEPEEEESPEDEEESTEGEEPEEEESPEDEEESTEGEEPEEEESPEDNGSGG